MYILPLVGHWTGSAVGDYNSPAPFCCQSKQKSAPTPEKAPWQKDVRLPGREMERLKGVWVEHWPLWFILWGTSFTVYQPQRLHTHCTSPCGNLVNILPPRTDIISSWLALKNITICFYCIYSVIWMGELPDIHLTSQAQLYLGQRIEQKNKSVGIWA